jgi:hypothetical protein
MLVTAAEFELRLDLDDSRVIDQSQSDLLVSHTHIITTPRAYRSALHTHYCVGVHTTDTKVLVNGGDGLLAVALKSSNCKLHSQLRSL